MPANRARVLRAQGEKRALVGNLTMPVVTVKPAAGSVTVRRQLTVEADGRRVPSAHRRPQRGARLCTDVTLRLSPGPPGLPLAPRMSNPLVSTVCPT